MNLLKQIESQRETSSVEKTMFINSDYTPENLVINKHTNPKRVIYGLSGIVNTMNTCYMNSAIQAFSHNYLLTNFLFNKKEEILKTLKKNARKILKDEAAFKLDSIQNIIPMELRKKIQDERYSPEMLTEEETTIVYNSTITAQLIRMLERMWLDNCTVIPTSFRKVFSEARNKFFFGYHQHDAEEAYSCILQKMQEELAEEKNIKFKTNNNSVQDFLKYKNEISKEIYNTTDDLEKMRLYNKYKETKAKYPMESLTIEAFREMKKYYGSSYSGITEIFSGFLHSSMNCPNIDCGHSSNKFEPFLHLSLEIPTSKSNSTIYECLNEYCKQEILDENNRWLCERCNNKVKGIKKLQLWTAPPFLVVQFKRFGIARVTKNHSHIDFPMNNFDISSYISPARFDKNDCYKYKLQCVINHQGTMNSGHYFTYCLNEDTNEWFKFDDSHVTRIAYASGIISSSAYLLFYMREDFIRTDISENK